MLNIKIVNDRTGDDIVGNYNYFVYINNKCIHIGRIENHNRISGWQGLVSCLSEVVHKEAGMD